MSSFLVYRASAGSGKTFMLVRKYLECVFKNPDDYRRVIAVTFTNKAADEMKQRILKELDRMSREPGKSDHIKYLSNLLKCSLDEISAQAGMIKKRMLHDYSRIAIGTIDKFFQQILRAFAREEGISPTYEVDLDANLALEEITARLFRESAETPKIKKLLLDWILERMESGKAWHRLESDLVRMGRELLKEKILEAAVMNPDGFLDEESIQALKNKCYSIKKTFEEGIKEIADSASQIILSANLVTEDFNRGKTGPAGFLQKTEPGKFESSALALSSLDNPDKWTTKSRQADINTKIRELAYPELNQLMHKLFDLNDSNGKDYRTAIQIIRNIHTMGLARYMVRFLIEYGKENDSLLLNLTQPIIRRIIGENPAPFIYEKTGSVYRHYLIDEFQDTSSLQWDNFKLLLENSLAENGLSMVVGDVKQSIYRWRNSNWRLLHEQAVEDLKTFGIRAEPLLSNQRSRKNIIDFNNSVFRDLPGTITGYYKAEADGPPQGSPGNPEIIGDAYRDVKQKRGKNAGAGGRVEIIFRDQKESSGEEFETFLAGNLPAMVEDLLSKEKGYRQEDILFLVRKNIDGEKIIRLLRNYQEQQEKEASEKGSIISEEQKDKKPFEKWFFVSTDIFKIGSNTGVRKIILALQIIAEPAEPYFQKLLTWEHASGQQGAKYSDPGMISPVVDVLLQKSEKMANEGLVAIIDQLVEMLDLHRDSSGHPFILQFRDLVKTFAEKRQGHVRSFLDWWETTGSRQMLVNDNSLNAMKIMTIHKAKGLSSPVVIIPYCNWEFDHTPQKSPNIWVPTEGTPFSMVGMLPVVYSSSLRNTWFAGSYLDEWIDTHLDNLNLLYVAFTRPKDILIAFCPYSKRAKTVADGLYSVLCDDIDPSGRFIKGDPDQKKKKEDSETAPKQEMLKSGEIRLGRGNLKLPPKEELTKEEIVEGLLVHKVLEGMRTRGDLETSLLSIAYSGEVSPGVISGIGEKINLLFELPKVHGWFDGSGRVMNEIPILVPGGEERRPDRVVICGDRAEVIDYKTGKPESIHKNQVAGYMELLEDMGYRQVNGYILYIDEPMVVEVVRHPGETFLHPL